MTLLKNVFIVATVLAAQGANAWTFKTRDESGKPSIASGGKTTDCKTIDHAGGKLFEWDPEDDAVCISMYTDDLCEGNRAGLSCGAWKKPASRDLTAFKVVTPKEAGQAPSSDDASATDSGSETGTASETGSASATGSETGSASEPTGKPTGKPTKTGSDGEVGSATAPNESATGNPSATGAPGAPQSTPTDAASSSGASDAPASSTQTGAASPTGAPITGIVGALAAVAAVAL